MRILVHEFSGFAFPIELSRALAHRGHEVLHVYCSSFPNPKGRVEALEIDPRGFSIEDIALGERFERFSAGGYSYGKRVRQELRYGRLFIDRARSFDPDVVISGDTPLLAQWRIVRWANDSDTPFAFWQQDIYSLPMKAEARRRLGGAGGLVGNGFVRLEKSLLRRSQVVVPISEDFENFLLDGGVDPSKICTVHNWAPVEQLPVTLKTNTWSMTHRLHDKRVLMYTGTLGLKHNPQLLWALGKMASQTEDVRVVVASEGGGMDWLRERMAKDPNPNLVLLPFQDFEDYADVMGSADVLIAILEPDAGAYAVPSKVLSYHCAGKPILASMPEENLAARIILRHRTGVLVSPRDEDAFVKAAVSLLSDPAECETLGRRARRYAEEHFGIASVTDRFEKLLREAVEDSAPSLQLK